MGHQIPKLYNLGDLFLDHSMFGRVLYRIFLQKQTDHALWDRIRRTHFDSFVFVGGVENDRDCK